MFNYWWLAVWLGDGNGSEVSEFYLNIYICLTSLKRAKPKEKMTFPA